MPARTLLTPGATPAGRRQAGCGRGPRRAGADAGDAGAVRGGSTTSAGGSSTAGRTRTAPRATCAAGASGAGGRGRLPARETPLRSMRLVMPASALCATRVEVDRGSRDDAGGVRLERDRVLQPEQLLAVQEPVAVAERLAEAGGEEVEQAVGDGRGGRGRRPRELLVSRDARQTGAQEVLAVDGGVRLGQRRHGRLVHANPVRVRSEEHT